ncbi:DoxX family protein [Streptomyces aidingensis]|uniref:Thiosulfate dehydrogenase [quinone] large subunit n=1 Tax=Streptomyces aidingensis TaxID=910347 RepID=A0A1I1R3C1_9ACTN|nr:DoxX family protein [Streptomyces aidingensis]SFD28795.1 thiosulfate dehydrogenase [quinone] large subunit [Streptomyces aidingensis]
MSVQPIRQTAPSPSDAETAPALDGTIVSGPAAKALAALRIATGLILFWAFVDKTFGLGYATPSERAWIEGVSPAEGYLSGVDVGPLEATFHAWAGNLWIDLMFMAGLSGCGLALILGVALRPTAVAGSSMMLVLWLSQWPPARELSDGSPSMSTNPLIDQHVIYAVVMIVVAACGAGRVWGLERVWTRLPFVADRPWLH